MSTTTKPHKTKPKAKSGKGKGKGKKKSLGSAKLAAAKKGIGEAAKPFGFILGLGAASAIGYGLDQIKALQPDETAEGFQVKKIIKPLVLLATGAGTIYATHGKSGNGMAFVNGIGWGVTGGGLYSGVKVVLKKDPFAGLGADPTTKKMITTANHYKAQAEDLANLLEQQKFEPKLPALPGYEDMKGLGASNFSSDFDYNNNQEIL